MEGPPPWITMRINENTCVQHGGGSHPCDKGRATPTLAEGLRKERGRTSGEDGLVGLPWQVTLLDWSILISPQGT